MHHDPHRRHHSTAFSRSAVAVACAALALAAAVPQSRAYTRSDNVGFTTVNQNPWAAGDAFVFDESWGFNVPFSNVALAPVGLNPLDTLLRSFMGIDVGFARVGAVASGSFGMEFGVYADGGRMNITYPGTGRIDIATRPATNDISLLSAARTTTAFTPGLYREFTPDTGLLMAIYGGPGYDSLNSIPGWETERFRNPVFQTAFPKAAAWADVDWNLSAGVRVEAGVARVRVGPEVICLGCTSRTINVAGHADTARLVHINPGSVNIIGLGSQPLSGQEFGLGGGTLRVSYPEVAVAGGLQGGGNSLFGQGLREILAFNGNLEQMVPILGPFLRQDVGPFRVKLLGVTGGPTVSLYQDFEVHIDPTIELRFSAPVTWWSPAGPVQTMRIVAPVGEAIDWKPMLGSRNGSISVQPTYHLNATLSNETGLAVGFELAFDSLEVQPGDLGPIDLGTLDSDAALRLPLFEDEFSIALQPITTRSIQLDVTSPVFLEATEVGSVIVDVGTVRWLGTEGDLSRFELGLEVATHAVHVGDLLCLSCVQGVGGGFNPMSGFFTDGDEEMFFTSLYTFRQDIGGPGAPQLNGAAKPIDQLMPPSYAVGDPTPESDFGFGPITPIPEPGTWALWLAGGGLMALLLGRERRRRA